MANLDELNRNLRDHFSKNAADLITIQAAFVGPELAQSIILECFRRHPNTSRRINARTVEAVLDDATVTYDRGR